MKAGVSIMLAIAVCASSSSMMVNAQKPTVGHTATLFDKTVFIQGGYGPDGAATNAAYSLLLSANGAYAGSSMLDITTLSAFSARGYHNSVDSVGGLMINCGGFGGDSIVNGKMSCDIFNPIKYNSTRMNMSKPNVKPRGGMAVAIGGETSVSAYFMGGSATLSSSVAAENLFSTDVSVLTLSSTLNWRVGTPMLVATRYHTATWIDSVKGIVVLGGQLQGGTAVAMNTAAIFSANVWTNRPIVGDVPPPRFGHSTVCDDSGKIYIYGGQAGSAGIIFNDIFVLDTAAATWAWKKINVPTAEPRAFHSSVLLVDGTILHTFVVQPRTLLWTPSRSSLLLAAHGLLLLLPLNPLSPRRVPSRVQTRATTPTTPTSSTPLVITGKVVEVREGREARLEELSEELRP
ncbi:MAG: hypothetical protein J3R72DRAFT_81139 [Linnemannia gamsii]|nr:MAG: hypothetical protein J3R72DRAFT_81139 [Linnemannia gamsii]